jgi:hypothetical protein
MASMEVDFESWCNRLLDVKVEVCLEPKALRSTAIIGPR